MRTQSLSAPEKVFPISAGTVKKLKETEKIILRHEKECYWVGGALRDILLRRATADFDCAFKNNPKTAAREVASKLNGALVALKEEREIYRVITPDGLQFDFARFKGRSIEEDLSKRDFTLNGMAARCPVPDWSLKTVPLLDPYGARNDLEKRIIRQISEEVYNDDPLRLLRAFRIAVQLGFQISPETVKTIKKNSVKIRRVAVERIRQELLFLMDCAGAYPAILKMDEAGLISPLFPEIDPNRKCALQYYPDKGVWGHSLDGLDCLEWILNNLQLEFPAHHQKISALLFQKGADTEGHLRTSFLKLAILFHDIGKAATAKMVEGRMRFFEHEHIGSGMAKKIAKRFKFSSNATSYLGTLVQAHMRPGGLAHLPILTEKAKYRFFRDLGAAAIPMLIVSLADRYTYLSADERGQGNDLHEKVTKELIDWHYKKELEQFPQKPKLVNGHELIKAFGIKPGPKIGELLREIDERVVLGKINNKQEALKFSESWIKSHT